MSSEAISSWQASVLLGVESAFGTSPTPAGSQALEFITCTTGPAAELGVIRPQKDRPTGRGMQAAFVEGRVAPIDWMLETSVKSRSAIDATPMERALLLGAGLLTASNSSTSYTATASNDPVAASAFSSFSLRRALGDRALASIYEAEHLRGCIVKQLEYSGGDKEVNLKASGVAQRKSHLGYATGLSLANGSVTSIDFGTTEIAYRFGLGLYLIESEVIDLTAIDYTAHTGTITRGAASTSATSHSSKALLPYMPSPTVSGSPISEGTAVSFSLDGVSIPIISWVVTFNTGLDASPGESGSKYFQQAIFKRYSSSVKVKALLRREQVALLGKVNQKKTPLAISLSQGSAVGGVITFTWSNMEIDNFAIPDTMNDVAYVDLSFRNFGSEFLITLT